MGTSVIAAAGQMSVEPTLALVNPRAMWDAPAAWKDRNPAANKRSALVLGFVINIRLSGNALG